MNIEQQEANSDNANANYTNYTVVVETNETCEQAAASSETQTPMPFDKRSLSKNIGSGVDRHRNSDDTTTSSSGTLVDGRHKKTSMKKKIFIPKAEQSASGSDLEDDCCETDSSMLGEETPLRKKKGTFEKEYAKLGLSILTTFLCTLINALVIAYINRFSVSQPDSLPDLVFNLLPEQTWAWQVADVSVLVCPIFTISILIFHKHYTIVLTRFFVLASTLYLLRAIFLMCTYLPPPFHEYKQRCLPANFSDDPLQFLSFTFGLVFRGGFSYNQSQFMCGDTIFSGHGLVFTLGCLMLWRETPRLVRPVPAILITCSAVLGLTCVVISRQHYTIDIVVAIFVTFSTFRFFHHWTMLSRQRRCFSLRPFRFRPLLAIFLFFEKNVPRGRLPADLAWPLPRPLLFVDFFDRLNQKTCSGGFGGCSRLLPPTSELDPESASGSVTAAYDLNRNRQSDNLSASKNAQRLGNKTQQQPFDV